LRSIRWSEASTCCACPCFDATVPGAPLADDDTHSATKTAAPAKPARPLIGVASERRWPTTNACACRFLPLVTRVGGVGTTSAPEGAGTSQVRHPSNDFGHLQTLSEPKTGQFSMCVDRTNCMVARVSTQC